MAGTFHYTLGLNEIKSKEFNLWRALVGEFIGNLILNFFACGACTQPEDGTFKALAFGFGVFMAITISGSLSGGHVNPAVTIAMLVTGRITLIRAVLYIIFQCMGAVAGTAAVKILLDDTYHNGLGHTMLATNVTELQGLGIEFFLGLVLVLTVFGACDTNKPESRYTAPLAIGMSVTLGHLGTIHYTGASMNPARTLGTAISTNNWNSHWIYWVGPIAGGITAALLYTQILQVPRMQKTLEDNTDNSKYGVQANERELKKLDSSSECA